MILTANFIILETISLRLVALNETQVSKGVLSIFDKLPLYIHFYLHASQIIKNVFLILKLYLIMTLILKRAINEKIHAWLTIKHLQIKFPNSYIILIFILSDYVSRIKDMKCQSRIT